MLNALGAIATLTLASVVAPVSVKTVLAQDSAQQQLASTDIEALVEESNLLFSRARPFTLC
ncbi:MAG: hypothetical protein HC799_17715 [Limnothrix sp. RL_2_0]|nr:hypothetical protein [Limnothrix sp. RL_2_0]